MGEALNDKVRIRRIDEGEKVTAGGIIMAGKASLLLRGRVIESNKKSDLKAGDIVRYEESGVELEDGTWLISESRIWYIE